jgi:hypothetical protein
MSEWSGLAIFETTLLIRPKRLVSVDKVITRHALTAKVVGSLKLMDALWLMDQARGYTTVIPVNNWAGMDRALANQDCPHNARAINFDSRRGHKVRAAEGMHWGAFESFGDIDLWRQLCWSNRDCDWLDRFWGIMPITRERGVSAQHSNVVPIIETEQFSFVSH